jgi:predicted glycoside hydrolase/deacetylase ChbG (UPF0249 family)
MSITAMVIAGIGKAVETMSKSSAANSRVEAQAVRYGTQQANTAYKQENILTQASEKAVGIADAEMTQLATIEMNKAEATADKTVSASAQGTTGGSVDQALQQTEINAAVRTQEAQDLADAQLATLLNNTTQSLIGSQGTKELQTDTMPTALLGALSGLSTFNLADTLSL